LVGDNRLVGQEELALLTVPDHALDGIEQVAGGYIGISEFTRCIEIVRKEFAKVDCAVSAMKNERLQVRPVPFVNPLTEVARDKPPSEPPPN
jgi:hypothetical protein